GRLPRLHEAWAPGSLLRRDERDLAVLPERGEERLPALRDGDGRGSARKARDLLHARRIAEDDPREAVLLRRGHERGLAIRSDRDVERPAAEAAEAVEDLPLPWVHDVEAVPDAV